MDKQIVKRKLTAILSADVEGYSRLMGEDEVWTIRTLTAYRDAMTELILQHRGRVVDAPGDNLLAEFASVVDAVQCAVEIQRELAERNTELPDERKMQFRIGVNLGDVVEEEERIYGDGVNIAARMEGLSEGGGVCISGTAFEHVENKLDLEFEDLGKHEVKNIAKPVRVYRVLSYPGAAAHRVVKAKKAVAKTWRKWLAATVAAIIVVVAAAVWDYYFRSPTLEPASVKKMAYPLPDKPSIAVLPFDNLSDDPEQEYFTDGFSESIISTLSKIPGIFVISRNSTFTYKGKPVKVQRVSEELGVRYVLEGSIQKSGNRIRITAQLIDALSGHHLWTERYDRDLKDIFALQDEITMNILNSLSVVLTEGETATFTAVGTRNIDAYLKMLQATVNLRRWNSEANAEARRLAKEAMALDPNYPYSYNILGWTYYNDNHLGWSNDPNQSISEALNAAQKAIALDESYDMPHGLLGAVYMKQRQYIKAVVECERAIELGPSSSSNYATLSMPLHYMGRYEEAILAIKKAHRLDPHPPSWYRISLGASYHFVGKYQEALAQFKKVLDRNPRDQLTFTRLAATLVQLDRIQEAQAAIEKVLKLNPKFSIAHVEKNWPYKNPADLDQLTAALQLAGLPDKPPLPVPDKPSIAVLPFDNMSDEPNQEYFGDGITEEIITALSKSPKLFVIARNSSFTYKGKSVIVQQVSRELGVKYVLEGSVRKAGKRVRITAQLIDATTGRHLWAERYDRELEDIFVLQDEITKKILSALQVKLTEGEIARWFEKGTDSLDAYFAVLKGREYYYRQDREGNSIARSFFQEALEYDPDYAIAYSHLARTHFMDMWLGSSKDPRASLRQALKLAQKSISLDGNLADAHAISGYIYTLMRQYDKSISEGKRAVELNPNSDQAQFLYGLTLHYYGRRDEAIRIMEKAIRLNPMPTSVYYNHLGSAYYHSGRYEEAIEAFHNALQLSPNHPWANLGLAICYSLQGRKDEAHAAAQEALRANPKFTIEGLAKRSPYKNQEDTDRMVTALRRAGMK
jgi:adenylate cyclase